MLCTNLDSHCEKRAIRGIWGNDLLMGASPNGWQHDSFRIQGSFKPFEDQRQLVQTTSFRKNLKQNL